MKLKRLIPLILLLMLAVISIRYFLYNIQYRLQYRDIIAKYSEEYNVDAYLIMSIINTESRFDKDAVSQKGAIGLMQITKPTAEWIAKAMKIKNFNADDLYDPETNIKMGTWYISNLREEFSTTELVLAAYNAGRGNVNDWINNATISDDGIDLGNIPYNETVNYVKKVLVDEKIYKMLY